MAGKRYSLLNYFLSTLSPTLKSVIGVRGKEKTIYLYIDHVKENISNCLNFSYNNNTPKKIYTSVASKSIVIPTRQTLHEKSKESKVPSTRIERMASFGGLAASLSYDFLKAMAKSHLGIDNKSSTSNIISFLNEKTSLKIVDTLCKTRGAALKIGQMISLQDVFDPEIAHIFERVRQSAYFMPYYQVESLLKSELGDNWKENFNQFDQKPFAAASIGQVHRAILQDGREVAIKIQYPGVAESIESDINNLLGIMKLWKLLPDGLFIDNIAKVGRKELSWEVDYIREATYSKKFDDLITPIKYLGFYVPKVINHLSTRKVLTVEMINGIPVDKLNTINGITQQVIDSVVQRLLYLTLHEVFIFNCMQTDPNWSNFFYDPQTDVINLLDFGACREFSEEFVDKYIKLIEAASLQDRKKVLSASKEAGFLTGYESKIMEEAHTDAVMILGEAFSFDGIYDFGKENTTKRITQLISVMLNHRLTPPPEESYSLHRKTSGIFLLATKLKARVNCKKLFDQVYYKYNELKQKKC